MTTKTFYLTDGDLGELVLCDDCQDKRGQRVIECCDDDEPWHCEICSTDNLDDARAALARDEASEHFCLYGGMA